AVLIAEVGATAMQATPATWQMLFDSGWPGHRDLHVLCGGEALPVALASRLRAQCRSLWNLYGPTETTIWSAAHVVAEGEEPVRIGRPLANTDIHLLDRHLAPVPLGARGELYIGGVGVSRGYLGLPGLTAGRFVPDPFSAAGGMRPF